MRNTTHMKKHAVIIIDMPWDIGLKYLLNTVNKSIRTTMSPNIDWMKEGFNSFTQYLPNSSLKSYNFSNGRIDIIVL